MKILLIKPSALGDIVQALPVLTGLKRQWPEAEIDWIVNDTLAEIMEGHPALRRVILYPASAGPACIACPRSSAGARSCATRNTTSRSTCRACSAAA